MNDEDITFSTPIAAGFSAADIVEDPLPLVSLADDVSGLDLDPLQPSLSELIMGTEDDLTFQPARADGAAQSDSGNYATALVDSPFDAEWLFTTTASLA